MTTEGDIVSAEFVSKHPELHHYTSGEGLSGIVESKSLWATRYDHLNDSSEVIHLKGQLVAAVAKRFEHIIRRMSTPKAKRLIKHHGGVSSLSMKEASSLVRVLYRVTFDKDQTPPYADPYITSFCTHSADKEYERHNGLLSQWRSYGRGGYCIVFDTDGLINRLREEVNSYYWTYANVDETLYATEDIDVDKLFADLIDQCDDFMRDFIATGKADFSKDFAPFVTGATLFKHQGFREEREARIVISPAGQKFIDRLKEDTPTFEANHPLKKIEYRRADAFRYIPYISLLKDSTKPLPIRRVIVGPSKAQLDNARIAERVLDGAAPVVRSATPYLG